MLLSSAFVIYEGEFVAQEIFLAFEELDEREGERERERERERGWGGVCVRKTMRREYANREDFRIK